MRKKPVREPKELRPNAEIWAHRITEIIEEKNMRQYELAADTKNEIAKMPLSEQSKFSPITPENLSKWISGKGAPSLRSLMLVARTLNVSLDYLVGFTDSREINNVEINKRIGLSDKAITALEQMNHEERTSIQVINYLIEVPELFEHLKKYLTCFVIERIQKSKGRFVPLKTEIPDFYEDIYYSALLNCLPKFSEKMAESLKKDEKLVGKLAFEYLLQNIDEEKARKVVDVFNLDTELDEEESTRFLSDWEANNPTETEKYYEELDYFSTEHHDDGYHKSIEAFKKGEDEKAAQIKLILKLLARKNKSSLF